MTRPRWTFSFAWIAVCLLGMGVACQSSNGVLAEDSPASTPSIDSLLQELENADPTRRFAAAEALGKLGPMALSAAPALIKHLDDRELRESLQIVTVEDQVWVAASKALAELGGGAVPELIVALDNPNPQIVRGAALSIHVIGPPAKEAVPTLIKILERDDDDTRHQAILGLAGIGPDAKAAVPLLIKNLHHSDFHTQYQSSRALARIGEAAAPAMPDLVKLLEHRVTSVRRNAAEAIGELHSVAADDAIAGLIALLEDPIEPVREAAVTALGKFGRKAQAAVEPLRDILQRERLATPTATLLALYRITGDSADAIPTLLAEIDKPDAPWTAAAALAQIKPTTPGIVDGLTARLSSADAEARLACAKALGEIGPDASSSEQGLKKLLDDEDEIIRAAAQSALERIAGPMPSP